MAHSTSSQQAVELPRYRGRKSRAEATGEIPTKYESFDSTYSSNFAHDIPGSPDSTDLKDSADLTTTASLLDKSVIRKLVFRRHWFHTDMTIYTAHLNSPSINPAPELHSSTPPTSKATSEPEPETPVYHLETTTFSLVKPDIIMYAGPNSDTAHVLAVAHFRWSRNARLGFGADAVDPDSNPNGVVWEELRNTSSYLLHYSYEFSVPTILPSKGSTSLTQSTSTYSTSITSASASDLHAQSQSQSPSPPSPSPSSTQQPQAKDPLRRTFKLLRTHSPTAETPHWTTSLSFRNYLLIDVDYHETIGVFLADNLRSLTKKGELRLFRPLAKEVEIGVVLALGVVSEKATRRERAGKGGGGG